MILNFGLSEAMEALDVLEIGVRNKPRSQYCRPMHKILLLYLHQQLMEVSYNNTNSMILDFVLHTTRLLWICRKHNE
jgi:hypothetical protein